MSDLDFDVRIKTEHADPGSLMAEVGSAVGQGSFRVPVLLVAGRAFALLIVTRTGEIAVKGTAEVVSFEEEATWVRFLSATDQPGSNTNLVLTNVEVTVAPGFAAERPPARSTATPLSIVPPPRIAPRRPPPAPSRGPRARSEPGVVQVPSLTSSSLSSVAAPSPPSPSTETHATPPPPVRRPTIVNRGGRTPHSTVQRVVAVPPKARGTGRNEPVTEAAPGTEPPEPAHDDVDAPAIPKVVPVRLEEPRAEPPRLVEDRPLASSEGHPPLARPAERGSAAEDTGSSIPLPPSVTPWWTAPQGGSPAARRPPTARHEEGTTEGTTERTTERTTEARHEGTTEGTTPEARTDDDHDAIPIDVPETMPAARSAHPADAQPPTGSQQRVEPLAPPSSAAAGLTMPIAPPISPSLAPAMTMAPAPAPGMPGHGDAWAPNNTAELAQWNAVRAATQPPVRASRAMLWASAALAASGIAIAIGAVWWARGVRAERFAAAAPGACPPTDTSAATAPATAAAETPSALPAAPLDDRCQLRVSANADPASLWIDGEPRGTTPTLIDIPCRPTKVELRHPRYNDVSQIVEPSRGVTDLDVRLTRPVVTVKIMSRPLGATVRVNGRAVGVTPVSVPVPAFEHGTIVWSHIGGATKTMQIYPKTNGTVFTATLPLRRSKR